MKKVVFAILILILYWLSLLIPGEDSKFEAELNQEITQSLNTISEPVQKKSHIIASDNNMRMNTLQLIVQTARYSRKELARPFFWRSTASPNPAAVTAMGTDFRHHFINSFLTDFAPFETAKKWLPQYVVSMRVKYMLDKKQYFGLEDVWQNGYETYTKTLGDCEDHSILLADWLISMGLDARVALGKYKDTGHAWVVVFKDSAVYLIEATDKRKFKKWQHFPLAKFTKDYRPEYMFNREFLWINTGSSFTVNYQDDKWVIVSRFFD